MDLDVDAVGAWKVRGRCASRVFRTQLLVSEHSRLGAGDRSGSRITYRITFAGRTGCSPAPATGWQDLARNLAGTGGTPESAPDPRAPAGSAHTPRREQQTSAAAACVWMLLSGTGRCCRHSSWTRASHLRVPNNKKRKKINTKTRGKKRQNLPRQGQLPRRTYPRSLHCRFRWKVVDRVC